MTQIGTNGSQAQHFLSTDPVYQIDLLQYLASYFINDVSQFDQNPAVHAFGTTIAAEAPRVFSGRCEAAAFIRQVRFHEMFSIALLINPLFERIDVSQRIGQALDKQSSGSFQVQYQFCRNGEHIDGNDLFYARIHAPKFVVHSLRMPVMRICEFQSFLATMTAFPERGSSLKKFPHHNEPGVTSLRIFSTELYKPLSTITLWTYALPESIPARLFTATHAAWYYEAVANAQSQAPDSGDKKQEQLASDAWDIDSHALLTWLQQRAQEASDYRLDDDGTRSGLIPVHLADLTEHRLARLLVTNGVAYDGASRLPNRPFLAREKITLDTKYRSVIRSSPSESHGIYLRSDGLPNPTTTLVARENRIPIKYARTYGELEALVGAVQPHSPNGVLLFRGQTNEFTVQRTSSIRQWLYGDDAIPELSLIAAASRAPYQYDQVHGLINFYLQGLLYSRVPMESFIPESDDYERMFAPFRDSQVTRTYRKWREMFGESTWDMLVMGVAQHYGVPTHGLDLTADLSVAVWFALNEYYSHSDSGEASSWYRPVSFREGSTTQPVIYVVETDGVLRRNLLRAFKELPLPTPTRIERQQAYLHYGGWSLQSNACAEDVRLAIRLTSEFEMHEHFSAQYLFPDADEDPMYKMLLHSKARESVVKTIVPEHELPKSWLSEVALYKNPLNRKLYTATNHGDFDLARELLQRGARPDFRDDSEFPNAGLTPLHWAAFYGDMDALRMLVAHGADIEAEDKQGRRPLVVAAINGRTEAVEFLLRQGASRIAMTYAGWTMVPPDQRSHDVIRVLTQTAGPEFAVADRAEGRGVALFSQNEFEQALVEFEGSVAGFERLLSQQPHDDTLAYRLASALNNTAAALLSLNRYAEAGEKMSIALAGFRALWDKYPTWPAYGNDLASTLNNLAILRGKTDDVEQAEQFFIESLRVRDDLIALFPNDQAARVHRSNTVQLLDALRQRS